MSDTFSLCVHLISVPILDTNFIEKRLRICIKNHFRDHFFEIFIFFSLVLVVRKLADLLIYVFINNNKIFGNFPSRMIKCCLYY